MNAHQTLSAGGEVADVPIRDLIASDRVAGTAVFRSNGDRIGRVERIMLDRRSGRAAYAVVNVSELPAAIEESYPLPWSVLTYDTGLGGYVVNVSDEQLKGAPRYHRDEDWWSRHDPNRDPLIHSYWAVPPYWA